MDQLLKAQRNVDFLVATVYMERHVQLVSLRIGDGKLGNEGRNDVARARSARKRKKIVSTIASGNLISLTHISRIELVSKIDRGQGGKSGTND